MPFAWVAAALKMARPWRGGHNENRILGAIPQDGYRQLMQQLDTFEMQPGELLCAQAAPIGHLYFPTSGIVAPQSASAAGDTAEIALVGNEGMVGFSALPGGNGAIARALVQSAGENHRVPAAAFAELFQRSAEVRKVIPRYVGSA